MSVSVLSNISNGHLTSSYVSSFLDVVSPATGKLLVQIPLSGAKDVEEAVIVANTASVKWQQQSPKTRSLLLLKLHSLIEAHANELADLIMQENGKNTQEALYDISKGLELIEWAMSLSQLSSGKQLELSRGVVCQESRQPVGIVAAIAPSCSLGTVPMMTIATALLLGNCVIYKPSERTPLTAQRIAKLMSTAGFPSGVLQVLHGTKDVVNALCDHPAISAVTFVGTSGVADHVNKRCQATSKRVFALGGAKNYAVALPDCDVTIASRDIVASFTDCAGQRCFATSVLLLAGDATKETKQAFTDTLLKEIVSIAGQLTAGQHAGQVGPLICAAARERVLEYINEAEAQGGKILLDGRSWAKEHPEGFWVGPTIILHSNVSDRAMKEEIFGPVLSVYHASSWDEAIAIENASAYGVAASVFTDKGAHAEWFTSRFRAATVGVNEAFRASREPIVLDGRAGSRSKFGGHDLNGEAALDFFSNKVRLTTRWTAAVSVDVSALQVRTASPLTVANLERQRANGINGVSPIATRKAMSPRSPEFTLPRGNSTPKEGVMRRDSSVTIKEAFTRANSANSDFSSTTDGAEGETEAEFVPKPQTFHGIAATSPFASSDPQFDFDLERLQKRDESFQPCLSAQPSFDHDAQREFGRGCFVRENSDMSALSGISDDLNQRCAKTYFNIDLFAMDTLHAAQTEAFDSVVDRIAPHEEQLKYRTSAVRFLKKLLRKALQCNIFETGLPGIKCFLPTDPIQLSVVLSGKLESCWQILVRDGLTKALTAAPAVAGVGDADAAGSDGKHVLKRVEVTKLPNTASDYKATCTCDATEVEVSLNSKNDVYMLAFYEEVNNLVGQNGLFKRSLLLIRAWWYYETSEYIDAPTKQQLGDGCLAVMVCAIFNQYHARISSPLQALCLFLAEYSAYDGATHAITLQGIVPFKTADGAEMQLSEPTKKHLISKVTMEKYWQLFNIDDVVKAKNLAGNASPPLSPDAPSVFVRDTFSVLHPFQSQNMIRTFKPAERKAGRFSRAFTEGAKSLSLALSKAAAEADTIFADVVNTVFPVTLAKFSEQSRPDSFNSSISEAPEELAIESFGKESMSVSVDKLWQNIMYCNFIIKSIVSESAILTFCIDMLSMMGLLTADDLGKRLNEASKVPQLMVALKEQVGGLKEFLKRFPDVFVFSYEHPYNPHIFLRIALAPELQAEVENGVLPVKFLSQIIAKFGRIAPPPPKVDSPSLRRGKMMASAAVSAAPNTNNVLDEKVVFGHERSAGGANTLLLMQSDLDLVNVNVNEPPVVNHVSPTHSDPDVPSMDRSLANAPLGAPGTVPSFINPYAAPFVSQQHLPPPPPVQQQQQLTPNRALYGASEKSLPIRKPTGSFASTHSTSPLTVPQSSPFYQDLGLMSSSMLSNSVSLGLSGGLSAPTNGSLAFSSSANSRPLHFHEPFHESDALHEGFLDSSSDFFGDSLSSLNSLNGDSRLGNNGHIDLLSSLRENSKELRDDSSLVDEYSPAISLGLSSNLSGGAATLASRTGAPYPPSSRSRYGQQGPLHNDGYPEYEYDTSVPNLDPYHQATNQVKLRAQSYPSQQPHMGGMGSGLEEYAPEGGYQSNYGYHNDNNMYGNGGGQGQYGQQPPTYGAPPNRGQMVRSNSRPLMNPPQPQGMQQQQQQQQPKFQHKRYDVAQQFKK